MTKRILIIFICCFLLFLLSSLVHAGSSYGKVTKIYAHWGDVIMFSINNGEHKDAPSCVTVGEWAFSLNNQTGKAMYALLLSAHAQGKSIYVSGTNQCSVWGDRETPNWMAIDP